MLTLKGNFGHDAGIGVNRCLKIRNQADEPSFFDNAKLKRVDAIASHNDAALCLNTNRCLTARGDGI
ncbi:MAG: hypothetical protein AAB074_04885 [Planctomycetota bacterium]